MQGFIYSTTSGPDTQWWQQGIGLSNSLSDHLNSAPACFCLAVKCIQHMRSKPLSCRPSKRTSFTETLRIKPQPWSLNSPASKGGPLHWLSWNDGHPTAIPHPQDMICLLHTSTTTASRQLLSLSSAQVCHQASFEAWASEAVTLCQTQQASHRHWESNRSRDVRILQQANAALCVGCPLAHYMCR